MRIIKKPSSAFSLLFTCKCCGAELQAGQEDLERVVPFEGETSFYVKCPCCDWPLRVDAYVPDGIRCQKAMEKNLHKQHCGPACPKSQGTGPCDLD